MTIRDLRKQLTGLNGNMELYIGVRNTNDIELKRADSVHKTNHPSNKRKNIAVLFTLMQGDENE